MNNSLIIKSLPSVTALVLCGLAFNAFAAFEDPATASWGGWTRGTVGTTYAEWQEYDTADDFAADIGMSGTALAHPITNNPFGFVASATGTNNIYSFNDTPSFTTYTQPFSIIPGPDGITAALQIRTSGTALDIGSVYLTDLEGNDIYTPSYTELSSIDTTSVGGPTQEIEHLFVWSLDSDLGFYQFNFDATGAHMSLIAHSFDIGPAFASTAVPIPAAFPLLGSALLGLIGLGRSK